MANCYLLGHDEARRWLRKNWWILAILPTYSFVLFWFRLGGFLAVLNDRPQWRTARPWQEAAKHGNRLMTQTYVFLCQVGTTLTTRPVAILAGVIGVTCRRAWPYVNYGVSQWRISCDQPGQAAAAYYVTTEMPRALLDSDRASENHEPNTTCIRGTNQVHR